MLIEFKTVQVFYALSTCSGGLISMASFNAFDNNLIRFKIIKYILMLAFSNYFFLHRDGLLVPILDCLTGFYAG